jgi:hypothetical protein
MPKPESVTPKRRPLKEVNMTAIMSRINWLDKEIEHLTIERTRHWKEWNRRKYG